MDEKKLPQGKKTIGPLTGCMLEEALALAAEAAQAGEIPVGCVIVRDGQIVGRGRNRREENGDATAHAERMLASRASQTFDRDTLWGSTLYTTCEPCPMCTGAIYWANIGKIVYGISEAEDCGGAIKGVKNSSLRL